ncbi:thymidylate kinase [Methanobrevibacter arboriphilus]|jgi:dTMP kinase|uniref:Thymidylate kinase n=1 Tax=Methanobrevibacter arboriphilus TaxID=39441 RepID=A0ACA8R2S9_METAZ|nr:dTMP kinase [Methanobrevibacter arboriphilus]MCC7561320.1 dTMP kinase [Methanobrevibacter arboriphilus]BBL61794.1 thymidylate kinase [Methanobrevibacter arboriphilus]GLI12858.1 thymidylate kinase [Methanobrevibacter arboriphilus]
MYIVLEGIDGAGKTTQINALKKWLEDSGIEVESIVEPTDSDIGKLIREMLRKPNATKENIQKTLGLLFAADRILLMDKIANEEYCNKIIISDRSFYSSLAYQEPSDWIYEINKYAKRPDLVLLLDINVNLAIERCSGEDEFEKKYFLSNVKNKYLDLANDNDNFRIINANNGPNKVQSDIRKLIAPFLGICVSGID